MKNLIISSLIFCLLFFSYLIGFIIVEGETFVFFKTIDNNQVSTMLHSSFQICYVILSLEILIIIMIIRLKNYVYIPGGVYERNTECVIDPVTAEAIIDGKIDAKNLIMTCLTNLIFKKNIELIDTETIKLIHTDNTTEIEREVISLIFGRVGRGIPLNFSKFEEIFYNNNYYTLEFYEKLSNIKDHINNNLIKTHIVSVTWTKILHYIRIISLFLLINSFLVFLSPSHTNQELSAKIVLFIIGFGLLLILFAVDLKPRKLIDPSINYSNSKKARGGPFTLYIIVFIFSIIYVYLVSEPIYIVTLFISILINTFSYNFSNTLILTQTGKIEYEKALKLKKYLIDFSLIQERDINGIIIWDEYLVYATAFGIPSKVTEKIAESLLNLNISFQVFNSLI